MTKVWLVGTCDVEFTDTRYVCIMKEKALLRWEELRLELIDRIKDQMNYFKKENNTEWMFDEDGMYNRILKNLAETDPKKMDNYPQERPFIYEMELDE
jgi:hypothetical protein